jgi:hypothetical protein
MGPQVVRVDARSSQIQSAIRRKRKAGIFGSGGADQSRDTAAPTDGVQISELRLRSAFCVDGLDAVQNSRAGLNGKIRYGNTGPSGPIRDRPNIRH